MRLTSDQTIAERVQVIEDVLEKALDRGPEMSVESGTEPCCLSVFVITAPYSDARTEQSLTEIAREIEVLLS